MITQLTQSEYAVLNDDEILLENVIEGKHYKLTRSIRSGLTNRDLKPDAGTRDQLTNLLVKRRRSLPSYSIFIRTPTVNFCPLRNHSCSYSGNPEAQAVNLFVRHSFVDFAVTDAFQE